MKNKAQERNNLNSYAVIQNVADPRRNGRIAKVFELAEPRFRPNTERDFRTLSTVSYTHLTLPTNREV